MRSLPARAAAGGRLGQSARRLPGFPLHPAAPSGAEARHAAPAFGGDDEKEKGMWRLFRNLAILRGIWGLVRWARRR